MTGSFGPIDSLILARRLARRLNREGADTRRRNPNLLHPHRPDMPQPSTSGAARSASPSDSNRSASQASTPRAAATPVLKQAWSK